MTQPDRPTQAVLGALAADSLAMPAHWYYDREALAADYGPLTSYRSPLTPHPDSIMHRSHYQVLNGKNDILRDRTPLFGGPMGIHYHQTLQAGDSTLSLQLALLLLESLVARSGYDASDYLDRYLDFFLTPGRNRDTYIEEAHRHFFTNYARGQAPATCGVADHHIGGIASVPVLSAWFGDDSDLQRFVIQQHVALTHNHSRVLEAADVLGRILGGIFRGIPVRDAIFQHSGEWFCPRQAGQWGGLPDETVVGQVLSCACYIQDAFPAALFLAWKYHNDFDAAVTTNARLGGDNCHRGAVVGAILGAANGVPPHWLNGLRERARAERLLDRSAATP